MKSVTLKLPCSVKMATHDPSSNIPAAANTNLPAFSLGKMATVLDSGLVTGYSNNQQLALAHTLLVMVEEAPTSFSPFSLVDCTLLSHFSFNDFVVVAFLDLARDLDVQI